MVAFSGASSLFCHDKELGTSTDPRKMPNRLGVTSGIDRTYMLSFGQQYPPKYAGTAKSLEAGGKLFMLSSVAKWRGVSASDSEHQKIMKTFWA